MNRIVERPDEAECHIVFLKAVRDHLIDHGVDANQLTWRGYGESDPIADNTTAEGRELNRRVVLRILQR